MRVLSPIPSAQSTVRGADVARIAIESSDCDYTVSAYEEHGSDPNWSFLCLLRDASSMFGRETREKTREFGKEHKKVRQC